MTILLTLLLMTLSLPAWGAIYYVSPNGSGSACTLANPCSMTTGMNNAVGSDTVRFLDGVYLNANEQGWRTIRNGTSATARLTYEAVNRRKAIIEFRRTGSASGDTLLVTHSNVIVRGFEVRCRNTASGDYTWDCVQFTGVPTGVTVRNSLIEDIYAHDSGHQIFGCYLADNVELRNSSFDNSGRGDTGFGECNYITSNSSNRPCTNFQHHHNIFARCSANYIDHKNQSRNVKHHNNVFLDKRAQPDGGGGSADFEAATGGGPNPPTNTGNEMRDTIVYRPIANTLFESEDGHRLDYINNVIMNYNPVTASTGTINSSDMGTNVISSGNIHCPASDNVSQGVNRTGGGPANLINRPMSECTTRVNQILGTPGISSCEIGSAGNTTLVVDFNVAKHGPLYSAGTPGQLAVKYDGTDQTESSVTLTGDSQARIVLAQAPTAGQVVTITPAVGAIQNSAFIGGRTCDMPLSLLAADPGGTNISPNKIVDGRGLCGSNITNTPSTCTNNVGTTPGVQSLNQAVFRFYGEHAAEGINPMAPENQNISGSLGAGFRLRIGVRGGGNNAPSRGYELAARACTPGCGNWLKVTNDASGTGLIYQDDQVQEDGTPTTNQLSLGGKTFVAGAFLETPVDTPAVAISTTQQVEWEFSLLIPPENNPVSDGHSIEFRIKYGDGTDLPSYSVVPTVTMGSASSGITGNFTGRVQ